MRGRHGQLHAADGFGLRRLLVQRSTTVNMLPGVYYGGWKISGHPTLLLAPGIYVMAGGGISLSGGTITSVQGGTGDPAPVLIFNTDNPVTHTGQDSIDLTADATLKLHALDTGPYRGILVWNDRSGSNPTALVTLGGQTNFDLCRHDLQPEGPGQDGGRFGHRRIDEYRFSPDHRVAVRRRGNGNLDMPYDPGDLYHFPAKGLVH